jgi:hypothetical protein
MNYSSYYCSNKEKEPRTIGDDSSLSAQRRLLLLALGVVFLGRNADAIYPYGHFDHVTKIIDKINNIVICDGH